jgi:hypothetical protein
MKFNLARALAMGALIYLQSVAVFARDPEQDELTVRCFKAARNLAYPHNVLHSCRNEETIDRQIECVSKMGQPLPDPSRCSSKPDRTRKDFQVDDAKMIAPSHGGGEQACGKIKDLDRRVVCNKTVRDKFYPFFFIQVCENMSVDSLIESCLSAIEGGCFDFSVQSICPNLVRTNNSAGSSGNKKDAAAYVSPLEVSSKIGRAPYRIHIDGPAMVKDRAQNCGKHSSKALGIAGNGLSVDWGDGTHPLEGAQEGQSCAEDQETHTYKWPGTYTIRAYTWHPDEQSHPIVDSSWETKVTITGIEK